MMIKILSAAAVLVIAGSALAQGDPWKMRGTINFGNSPLIENSLGIVPTTSFYNHPLGETNGGPTSGGFPLPADLWFDSYWAIGAGPNTVSIISSQPYTGSAFPFVLTDEKAENNAGFANVGVGVDATLKEVNGLQCWALFVGRLTTVGEGSELLTKAGDTPFGSMGVWGGDPIGIVDVMLTLNGTGAPGPSGLDGLAGLQDYFLVSEVTEATLMDGTPIRTHDLYFVTGGVVIPTPGAIIIFGLAGLTAARRRRASSRA